MLHLRHTARRLGAARWFSPLRRQSRGLHIYTCTYEEQVAAFEQGLAPPDEPFAVSAAADWQYAKVGGRTYRHQPSNVVNVLNHDRGIDESEDAYRQRSLAELRSHVFTESHTLYTLVDSSEYASDDRLMYFGHIAMFILDPCSRSSASEPIRLTSFRRDPRAPLPRAQAAPMPHDKEGSPLHYRQLFGGLCTTAQEELGKFLLAPAAVGSVRCRKKFGCFVGRRATGLDDVMMAKIAEGFESTKAKCEVYGPLPGGEEMSLAEAEVALRTSTSDAARRVDWTLDNVFSVSSEEAFLKGVGLLAFGEHFRSHAASALLECLNWPADRGGPPAPQRAAACRALLGRVYSEWGYDEQAREWYGAASGEAPDSEDVELIKQFAPGDWWRSIGPP